MPKPESFVAAIAITLIPSTVGIVLSLGIGLVQDFELQKLIGTMLIGSALGAIAGLIFAPLALMN